MHKPPFFTLFLPETRRFSIYYSLSATTLNRKALGANPDGCANHHASADSCRGIFCFRRIAGRKPRRVSLANFLRSPVLCDIVKSPYTGRGLCAMKYDQIASLADALTCSIGRVIIGKEQETQLVLAAMLAGGHILLEDVPGTGKTTLAKSLARSLSLNFARVQFTPDLLPSDVTGMRVYNQQTGTFSFVKGPAFTHILLADEINRATPRTQSALLECMEERQITEGGVTYPLASPFLVIATQNPVETQGTFPLPEAQLDRFMIPLSLGYPTQEQAVAMLRRFMCDQPLDALESVASCEQLQQAAALCRTCHVSDDVLLYMTALCESARNPDCVLLGPSPRALLALMRCAQAFAAIHGRDYVIPDDVKALAVPVLAHRIILRGTRRGQTPQEYIQDILAHLAAPTEARA